jgi:glycosyltransferase involved in cell wall biosynthesis
MAANDLQSPILILVTEAFHKRDKTGLWQKELDEISLSTSAKLHVFANEFQALQILKDISGVMIAGSESHLNAHKPVRDLFRAAPSCFTKITLQHGYECVGFLQSYDQDIAHGTGITFAADIICGWCPPERLTAVAPSQRHKLRVTGPSSVLQKPSGGKKVGLGIVCENMHSIRLNTRGDFKTAFLDIFSQYCQELAKDERSVTLRPHPGGQYTIKNNVDLARNVVINNDPIYKVDLSTFSYGISAPSSILIDMLLADIPTAVWCDSNAVMDLGNYEGLTRISSLEDWLRFTQEAIQRPEQFLDRQRAFFKKQKLQIVQDHVYISYAHLLRALTKAKKNEPHLDRLCNHPSSRPTQRILFFAPSNLPTLQLSFIKPLKNSTNYHLEIITEADLKQNHWNEHGINSAEDWIEMKIAKFAPDTVVFCRYGGIHADKMVELLKEMKIPSIYHIDDDLLGIPKDIGFKKYEFHNNKSRIDTIRDLLNEVDIVYCSTPRLKRHFEEKNIRKQIICGQIYCSGEVINEAGFKPVNTIGYMASRDHEHNLKLAINPIIMLMRKYSNIQFEFFGSIQAPPEFLEFGSRIKHAPPIANYQSFLQHFAEYKWDVGICPLTPIHFNLMKANTKWVEYTSVGAAVIASKGTVYDECCSDGCGILADTEEEWFNAFEQLIQNPKARYQQVRRAQEKLQREYSIDRLRDQVINIFDHAKQMKYRL